MNQERIDQSMDGSAIRGSVSPVLYEKRGRVAYITMNRPHVLNAMNMAMHTELKEIWDDFEKDAEVWLGVLTGSGDLAFSVGQDLKELAVRNQAGVRPSSFGSEGGAGWPRLTERFACKKPIIARVNGFALGGGFELALACDIIVAAEQARFALPEARLGLIPGAGGVFRLSRQIPFRAAMGYLMTGRQFDADRALALGLVNEVVPLSDLDRCVEGWAQDILRCAPLSVRSIKEVVTASAHLSIESAFSMPFEAEEIRRGSMDSIEGPRAFLDKRDPVWSGI
jgi:dehydration protein DpgD